jgi:hypothetical protein
MIRPRKFFKLPWFQRGKTDIGIICLFCRKVFYVPGCYAIFDNGFYCEKCLKAELTILITRNEDEAKKVDVCMDLLKQKYGNSICKHLSANYASQ